MSSREAESSLQSFRNGVCSGLEPYRPQSLDNHASTAHIKVSTGPVRSYALGAKRLLI